MINSKNKLLNLILKNNEDLIKYIEENENDYFEIIIPNRKNRLFLQIIFDKESGLISVGYDKSNHIHYYIDDYKNMKELVLEINKDYLKEIDMTYEKKYLSNKYCSNIFRNSYYNESQKKLEINFDNGIYEYRDVPLDIVKEFNDCKNKWGFFNLKIKNNYKFQKIVSYESIF